MKRRLLSLILCGLMLLGGCGRQAVQEEIWELEEKNVATFSDGETVDRWRGYFENGLQEPWSVYELADGTVLLTEDDVVSVESDTAGYGSLTEEVQAAVSAWYQGEGKYYDLSALLSASYTRWQEQGESFVPGRVGQNAQRKLCIIVQKDNIQYKESHQFAYDILIGFRQMAEPAGFEVDVVPVDIHTQRQFSYDVFMLQNDYAGAFVIGFSLGEPWMKDLDGLQHY